MSSFSSFRAFAASEEAARVVRATLVAQKAAKKAAKELKESQRLLEQASRRKLLETLRGPKGPQPNWREVAQKATQPSKRAQEAAKKAAQEKALAERIGEGLRAFRKEMDHFRPISKGDKARQVEEAWQAFDRQDPIRRREVLAKTRTRAAVRPRTFRGVRGQVS